MKTTCGPALGALFAVLHPFSASASAQTSVAWAAAYAPPSADTLAGLVRDAQGRSFIAGGSTTSAQIRQGFVHAYDVSGAALWTRMTGFAGQVVSWNDIAIAPNGRIAVAGAVAQDGSPNSANALVAEYDTSGNLLWRSTWNSPAALDDTAVAVAFDPTGRVVVAGQTVLAGGSRDGFVAVFTATGQLVWATATGIPANESIKDIAIDGAGVIFAVGENGVPGTYVTRFEPNGAVGWSVSRSFQFPNAIAVDDAGGVYVVGSGAQVVPGPNGFFIAGLDALNGSQRFFLQVPWTAGVSEATDVAVTPFGAVVATGGVDSSPTSIGALTIACDANGTELWRDRLDFGPNRSAFGLALALGPGGDVTMVGLVSDLNGANALPLAAHYARGIAPTPSWTSTAQPLAGFTVQYPNAIVANGDGGVTIASPSETSGLDVVTWRVDPRAELTCFGDGSGTVCPCGNASAALERAGCVSSLGAGARLDWSGNPSLANDNFTLRAAFIGTGPGLYLQGSAAITGGTAFGDGLSCTTGAILRLGVKFAVSGSSHYPEPGDAPVSIGGQIPGAGTARVYQIYYRDAPSFCTNATFNLTNAVTTVWQP